MYINERARRVREINAANGWNPVTKKDWDDEQYKIPSLLALLHSEINEAHDELVEVRLNNLATELADIEIRVLDIGGGIVKDFEACVSFAWKTGVSIPDDLHRAFMSMHKYVTAALEFYRNNESGLFIGELAKLYIFNRCFAIYKFKLDIARAVEDKVEKNAQRSFRHGGKRV